MRHALSRASLFLILSLMPGGASPEPVEPGKEGELAQLVKPEDGERACFSRVYDQKHLDAHPDQQVTRMDFRLTYYMHEPDEYSPEGQRNYYFQLLVEMRNRKASRPLSATGECTPAADGMGIWCGVECDGGGVVLRRRDGDRLLVDLAGSGRIRMTDGCDGEEEGVEVVPGKDDRAFLLAQLPEAQCPVFEDW